MNNYDHYMKMAYHFAQNSLDPSTQNGAVLLLENSKHARDVAWSWNHFPQGVDEKHWYSSKEAKYARVVHAEVGVILNAAKRRQEIVGATLVCPWAACSNCSKHIADVGIAKLVRHQFSNNGVTTGSHWYEDCLIGDEIMREAGVEIIEIAPVSSDIELRRDGKLWSLNA